MLPGGVWRDDRLIREFRFREPDGRLDAALAEVGRGSTSKRVTRILTAALAELGGEPVDEATCARLCVADRQWLVRRLAAHLGLDPRWHHGDCASCGARFDFLIEQSALPVKPAGPGFPFAELEHEDRLYRLRVPTGEDQEGLPIEEQEAVETLVRGLILSIDGEPADETPTLSPSLIAAVDEVLERVSPETANAVLARCPECGAEHPLEIDPYLLLSEEFSDIHEDIHIIAKTYHWTPDVILSLPTSTRKRYLTLIAQDPD